MCVAESQCVELFHWIKTDNVKYTHAITNGSSRRRRSGPDCRRRRISGRNDNILTFFESDTHYEMMV